MPRHLWKFMRMRPANFPTVRLAQFAALVHKSVAFVLADHRDIFGKGDNTVAGCYRKRVLGYAFRLMRDSTFAQKHSVSLPMQNIIINTIAPIQFLYARTTGYRRKQEKALQLLEVGTRREE